MNVKLKTAVKVLIIIAAAALVVVAGYWIYIRCQAELY